MKTWLALILCKAELDIGLPVGWVDLDAMGPGAMLERLQLLGVTDDQIEDFLYYEPSQMLDKPMLDEITATIAEPRHPPLRHRRVQPHPRPARPRLRKNPDVETFWRTVADPICQAPAPPPSSSTTSSRTPTTAANTASGQNAKPPARSSTSASNPSSSSGKAAPAAPSSTSTKTAPATSNAPTSAGSSSTPPPPAKSPTASTPTKATSRTARSAPPPSWRKSPGNSNAKPNRYPPSKSKR
jgi:hypothetical protein